MLQLMMSAEVDRFLQREIGYFLMPTESHLLIFDRTCTNDRRYFISQPLETPSEFIHIES
jgi:hypothetical protein